MEAMVIAVILSAESVTKDTNEYMGMVGSS